MNAEEDAKWLQWVTHQFKTIAGEDGEINLQDFKKALKVKEASVCSRCGDPVLIFCRGGAIWFAGHSTSQGRKSWYSDSSGLEALLLSRARGYFCLCYWGPSIHGGSHGLMGSSKQHMKLEISSLSNLKKYY